MIGKAKWFQRRKYGGWGVYPKTWQGWVYLAVLIGIIALIQVIPFGNPQINVIGTLIVAFLAIVDLIDIMIHIPMDERDRLHEAKAERNALWVIIAVLVTGVGYQAATSIAKEAPQIDPVIIVALLAGVLAKAITNLYLDHKN